VEGVSGLGRRIAESPSARMRMVVAVSACYDVRQWLQIPHFDA
jgi:hypothetical protein